MKKKLLFILILLLATVVLFSCTQGDITALSVKSNSLTLALNKSFDVSQYVEVEGKGKLFYSIENSDVLSIDGSIITGKKEGKGAVIVTGGDFSVKINVTVVDAYNVSFELMDNTVYYNGKVHNVINKTNVPKGSTIEYYHNGEVFYGATEAGEYKITAKLTLPKGYSLSQNSVLSATLHIKKASYDLSSIHFGERNFIYDGTKKTVTLQGNLPNGVTVRYENNSATEAGEYYARAIFSAEDYVNYEVIEDYVCKFVINKKFVNLNQGGFYDTSIVYDGNEHSIIFNNKDENFAVEYFAKNGENYQKLSGIERYKNAGEYPFYLRIKTNEVSNKNSLVIYNDEVVELTEKDGEFVSPYLCSILTIKKANLNPNVTLVCLDTTTNSVADSIVYGRSIAIGNVDDNQRYLIKIDGALPKGENDELVGKVTPRYELDDKFILNSYSNIDTGTYTCKVFFDVEESYKQNYNEWSDTYTFTVSKATIDMSLVTFSAENDTVTFDMNKAYTFSVNAEAFPNFDTLVSTKYYCTYNANSEVEIKEKTVFHAGKYKIVAKFSLVNDRANYNAIANKSFDFTITPYEVILDGVTFNDAEYNYDGVEKTLALSNFNNEFVTVKYVYDKYYKNTFTDAGVYKIIAYLYYKIDEWEERDYVIKIDEKEQKVLSATLTINKANYQNLDTTIYEQNGEICYEKGLTLSSVNLTNNENNYVKWTIKTTPISIVETDANDDRYGYATCSAYYNADENNYNDYSFTIRIKIRKIDVDLSAYAVKEQFIASTGKPVLPYVENLDTDVVSVTIAQNVVEEGSYEIDVNFALIDTNNYRISGGSTVCENVKIHVYNSAVYIYEKGTTNLKEYVGVSRVADIQEGTTYVKANAFGEKDVTEIIIPDSVTGMAYCALGTVPSLYKLSLPSATFPNVDVFYKLFTAGKVPSGLEIVIVRNDTEITDGFYANTINLQYIKYLQKVTSIGERAFEGCSSLVALEMDTSNLTQLGANVFRDCASLTGLVLPSLFEQKLSYYVGTYSTVGLRSLTLTSKNEYSLVEEALKGANNVETVVFSEGLNSISAMSFDGVKADINLTSTSVTVIPDYAFIRYGGANLTLHPNTTSIGGYAFSMVKTLTNVIIPKEVTSIGACAFNECTASVTFAENSNYKVIGTRAFENYAGTAFDFSQFDGAESEAFKGSKIKEATVNFDLPTGMFRECTSLNLITLGEDVEKIGAYAFYQCNSIEKVVLPSAITEIGEYAFRYCSLLTEITFNATVPPKAKSGVFSTEGGLLKITVPTGYEENYRTYLDDCGIEGNYEIQ